MFQVTYVFKRIQSEEPTVGGTFTKPRGETKREGTTTEPEVEKRIYLQQAEGSSAFVGDALISSPL
jgi:hypothetical protein